MKKALISLAALTFAATSAMGQAVLKSNSGDFSLRFIGRTNLDYGRYINHSDEKDYGFKMNDTRLGVIANFDEKWSAKAEICYANKAISFRDLWIGYKINDKMSLTGGNHFQPFGAKTLGLAYKFIEDAQTDYAICPSRKIGISYKFVTNPFLGQAGIYSDANVDALSGTTGINQGYSVAAKAIVRPICGDSSVLHIGVGGMYTDVANAYTYKTVQPETFDESRSIMSFTSPIANTININRGEAELIYTYKRFYFETHFLTAFSNLNDESIAVKNTDGEITTTRHYNDNFKMQGFYAQASFLLIGNKQNYNKATGLAQNASPKNLEILARVNHSKMDELTQKDELTNATMTVSPEQKETDFTLGLNYFFNKNLNARLNYTVSQVKYENSDETRSNNAIQARLQFSF